MLFPDLIYEKRRKIKMKNNQIEVISVRNNNSRKLERDVLQKRNDSLRFRNAVLVSTCIGLFCCTLKYSYTAANYEHEIEEYYEVELEIQRHRADKLDSELMLLNQRYDLLNERYNLIKDDIKESAFIIDSLSRDIEDLTSKLDSAEAYIEQNFCAPASKSYSRHSDLGITEVMSVDRMNRIIDYWLDRNEDAGRSPFRNRGDIFVKASNESGLDPIFIFAIACHESDFGRSKIARNKNNFMGIGAYDSSPYTSALSFSDNVEEGLVRNAIWVSENYYNKGQKSLDRMIYGKKCYSSSKEKWIRSINSIMSTSSLIK